MEPSPILAGVLGVVLAAAPPAAVSVPVVVRSGASSAPGVAVRSVVVSVPVVVRPGAASAPAVAVPVPAVVPDGASVAGSESFRWPLPGTPPVVRRFDPPPQPWLPGHRGVDLAAAPGTPVLAAGPGTVTFAGVVAGRPVVAVAHADGLRTTYEPVRPGLAVGAQVPAGAPIGHLLAGHPGCAAAACLHWGLRRGDPYLDPLVLLGRGPVRLLPLDGVLR